MFYDQRLNILKRQKIPTGTVHFCKSTRYPLKKSQFDILKCIRKSSVDRFVCLFRLFFHIAGNVPLADAFPFFVPALLESGKLLFMPAGADKPLGIAFSNQFHLFVADRAAGVGVAGDGLTVSALSVLADQHLSVFSVDFQHKLAALGAFVPGQVVMAEGA